MVLTLKMTGVENKLFYTKKGMICMQRKSIIDVFKKKKDSHNNYEYKVDRYEVEKYEIDRYEVKKYEVKKYRP